MHYEENLKLVDQSLFGRIRMQGVYTYAPDHTLNIKVSDNHVHVWGKSALEDLDDQQKLKLFNCILGEYRKLSSKDCGLFAAALGITEGGNIYIAYNTNETDPVAKNCAEANLSNAMQTLTKGRGKFRSIYLMAGLNGQKEEIDLQDLEDPVPPCGRCSDILEQHCSPDAKLTVLPANNGLARLTLNHAATSLAQIKKGEAWEMDLHKILLAQQEVTLPEDQATMQRNAWQTLEARRRSTSDAPDAFDAHAFLQRAISTPDQLNDEERRLLAVIYKAAEKAAGEPDNTARIEADPTLTTINRFMVDNIAAACANRSQPVSKIRCAVIRHADGSFSSNTEVESPEDNAVIKAEFVALCAHRLRNQPITDIWVMEATPEDIARGVMHTSPKEMIERAYKRRPHRHSQDNGTRDFAGEELWQDIRLHYIPFNDGTLSREEIERIMHSPRTQDIYPSLFGGSQQIKNGHNGNGCCPGH